VTWKLGVDSHTDLLAGTPYKDNTADPQLMEFARVEITPNNGSYLEPDAWTLRVDQAITPNWFSEKHKSAAHSAHKKWLTKLDKILVRKQIVHPFKITPPLEITKKHINMLRKWDSVRDSVRGSVGGPVRGSVWGSVGYSVGDSVWDSVRDSVRGSVGYSVGYSVGDSVWGSVRDSVGAYIGSFFILPVWKYIKHSCGKYPFAPCVQLWNLGLVPSFDGTTWRLHGRPKAAVLFEISAEELRGTE
jgi:hypothetical protein